MSSCSSSCDSACGSSFTECAGPASGGSGSIITSCTSGSPTTTVPWTGTWTISSQCDLNQCCCLSDQFTISQSGSDLVLNGPVTGQCGATTSATLSVPYPTTYSFSADPAGDGDTFTLSSDGKTITQIDHTDPACSATATKNSAIRADMNSNPMVLIIVAVVMVTLLS